MLTLFLSLPDSLLSLVFVLVEIYFLPKSEKKNWIKNKFSFQLELNNEL